MHTMIINVPMTINDIDLAPERAYWLYKST